MRIRFTEEAESEIADAVKWYNNERSDWGLEFSAVLDETILRALRFPYFNSEINPGFYRALMKRFPYGIIYSIEDDDLVVYAVAHLHRSPKYWLK